MCTPQPARSRSYDTCTREHAIDLAVDRGVSHAVRQLGITYPTIKRWITEYAIAGREIEHQLARQDQRCIQHA